MLDETTHVSRVKGGAVAVVEIVVAVAIKGSAEASGLGVVQAGPPHRQAHPPVTNVGPDEGAGGKDDLQEEGPVSTLLAKERRNRGAERADIASRYLR